MPLLSTGQRRRNRVLNVAAWLTLAGLLALVVATRPATAAQSESCEAHSGGTGSGGARTELGKFNLREKSFALRFDELLAPQLHSITVEAFAGAAGSRVELPDLRAAIEENVMSTEGRNIGIWFTTSAEVVRANQDIAKVRVCVALDPKDITHLRPGRYTGNIVLSASNFEDAAIPISATFRAPRSDGLKMAAGGVLLGLLVKMLSELASSRRAEGGRARDAVREYVLQWSFPLAIILGVVTGWLGFVEIYESSETWGVGESDSLKLFAACFGFQMGSIGGADMTKRLVG